MDGFEKKALEGHSVVVGSSVAVDLGLRFCSHHSGTNAANGPPIDPARAPKPYSPQNLQHSLEELHLALRCALMRHNSLIPKALHLSPSLAQTTRLHQPNEKILDNEAPRNRLGPTGLRLRDEDRIPLDAFGSNETGKYGFGCCWDDGDKDGNRAVALQ